MRPTTTPSHRESPPPVESDDGTDLSLIRWMLSLTPAERLRALQSAVDSLERMKRAAGR